MERTPGNAAVHYGKVMAEEIPFFANQQLREDYRRWLETPFDELRRDGVKMPSLGSIEDALHRAARCKYCDWQLPIGREPYYPMLLPDAQQSRDFGRILAARARLQMIDGEIDEALHTLQAGYALGRHVATGETIVNSLIGLAICSDMNRQLMDLIQLSDAPNLYWALTTLPAPMIDMRDGIEVDALGVELSFPEMKDLENAERSTDQWRELFHRFARQMHEWTAVGNKDEADHLMSAEELDKTCERMRPVAKLYLSMHGIPGDKLEKMAVHQIALIYTVRLRRALMDDAVKYVQLPYPQAIAGIKAAIEDATSVSQSGREIIPVLVLSLNVFRSARPAQARVEREFAMLRLVEALRMHAAGHQGNLPAKLSDISEVPVPDDPVTGVPFEYQLDGDVALIHSPAIPNAAPFAYAISMERK
jgi:hypothetical protein